MSSAAPASASKDPKQQAAAMSDVEDNSEAASAASSSNEKKEDETIADANVLTKYKEAGKIAQEALALVLKTAADGVAILDLVKLSDDLIFERTSKLYNNKKGITKGVAFPTSINVNNVVGHFAPMEKDQNQPMLATGDIVKIDLGVHLDGYIAVVAQTFCVPAKAGTAATTPITGRAADAYSAALIAADTAFRALRAGNKNTTITDLISQIAAQFNVAPVQGVLSHIMPRNKIDGNKAILNRADPEQKIDEVTFEANQVWGVDIVMSTGEGKPKEIDNRETTIYKRTGAASYSLKSTTSRAMYSEIQTKYGLLPFSLRYLEEAGKAKFGIAEPKEHDLVMPYPVLHEKEGEIVVQVKFTALISATGTTRITGPVNGLELNGQLVQSERKQKDFPEELKAAIKEITAAAASSSTGANKKKKKKTEGAAAAAPAAQ